MKKSPGRGRWRRVLLDAPDHGEAEAHLSSLPLVRAGLMTYQLVSVTEPSF